MKNVLLTGATRGLGLAVAEQLRQKNYHVIGTGRAVTSELERLIQSKEKEGKTTFMKLDLATDDLHTFIQEIQQRYGHLFGLINNAAIGIGGILGTMHDSQIEELIQVNVFRTILLTKYAVRSMLLNKEGRIVNISSIAAQTGFKGLSVYGASKSALIGFTKSLSRELGKANITVNALCPGFMKTDMTAQLSEEQMDSIQKRIPIKQFLLPSDVANGVCYLLSDEAKMVTGSVLTIDGGSSA